MSKRCNSPFGGLFDCLFNIDIPKDYKIPDHFPINQCLPKFNKVFHLANQSFEAFKEQKIQCMKVTEKKEFNSYSFICGEHGKAKVVSIFISTLPATAMGNSPLNPLNCFKKVPYIDITISDLPAFNWDESKGGLLLADRINQLILPSSLENNPFIPKEIEGVRVVMKKDDVIYANIMKFVEQIKEEYEKVKALNNPSCSNNNHKL